MLVLTRKLDEQIRIGDDVTITILRVSGNSVRVGIDAPRSVRVIRGELPPRPTTDGRRDEDVSHGAAPLGQRQDASSGSYSPSKPSQTPAATDNDAEGGPSATRAAQILGAMVRRTQGESRRQEALVTV